MNRILLFLICLSALAAKAQTTQMAYDGRLAVTVSRMALSGQTLELNLELQLLQALKTGKTLEVTPVLTDGTSSAVFSTITFMGRNKMREYHRSIALGNALADELAHIHDLMDEVGQSNGIVISKIDVLGYASPEGSVRNNLMLSANRARSMATYIADKYHLPATLFASQSGGEDWQGLDSLVRLDPAVPSRQDVLQLLATEQNAQQRKTRLAALDGGRPYSYMLANIYPQLRRVRVYLYYIVKNFLLEEAREVFREHPHNLSLNEMYQLALSYPEGSQDFVDIFETAVRLFPHDPTANLNAAVAALQQNNTERAESYLKKVEHTTLADTPQYHNALGGLQLLRGNMDAARVHFTQARDLPEAKANLRAVNELKNQ